MCLDAEPSKVKICHMLKVELYTLSQAIHCLPPPPILYTIDFIIFSYRHMRHWKSPDATAFYLKKM